jgi:flagellar basal body P-ring formation protein FlgA
MDQAAKLGTIRMILHEGIDMKVQRPCFPLRRPNFWGFGLAIAIALNTPITAARPISEWSSILEENIKRSFPQQNAPLDAKEPSNPQDTPNGLNVDVSVGAIDSRLQLAPCRRIQPFLPEGARLWGRSVMGMRCVSGANWSVTVPVQVTISGLALVARRPLPAGSKPNEQDFQQQFVELTSEPGMPVNDLAQIKGQVLNKGLAVGQLLRADNLRLVPTVNPGDSVKVRVIGEGFTLNYDGVALNAASSGQSIRVRAENGKVLTGLLQGREIQIQLKPQNSSEPQ